MGTDRHLNIIQAYIFRMSPENCIWQYNPEDNRWYLMCPSGEYWEDAKYAHVLDNSTMESLGWPEIKFNHDTREWYHGKDQAVMPTDQRDVNRR